MGELLEYVGSAIGRRTRRSTRRARGRRIPSTVVPPEWQTGRPVIGDVQGEFGVPGSSYVSRRGWLAARTTVLTAECRENW